MAGDYSRQRMAEANRSTGVALLATGATGVSLVASSKSINALRVQRIAFIPTTYATGTLNFREDTISGAIVGVITQPAAVSAGLGKQSIELVYGAVGYQLTAGKALFLERTATGSAGIVVIEAYDHPSGALTIAQAS